MVDPIGPPSLPERTGPAFFRELPDQLEEGVCAHDPGGQVLFANATLCRWLGRPEKEVVGRNYYGLWPPPQAAQDAAETARVLGGERLAQEEQRSYAGQVRRVRTEKVPLRGSRSRANVSLSGRSPNLFPFAGNCAEKRAGRAARS